MHRIGSSDCPGLLIRAAAIAIIERARVDA